MLLSYDVCEAKGRRLPSCRARLMWKAIR